MSGREYHVDDKPALVHYLNQCWLGALRQQFIIWTNVDQDLCHHMALLSYNELTYSLKSNDDIHVYMSVCQWLSSVQIMACHLFGAKPLPIGWAWFIVMGQNSMKFEPKHNNSLSRKCIWNHFVPSFNEIMQHGSVMNFLQKCLNRRLIFTLFTFGKEIKKSQEMI